MTYSIEAKARELCTKLLRYYCKDEFDWTVESLREAVDEGERLGIEGYEKLHRQMTEATEAAIENKKRAEKAEDELLAEKILRVNEYADAKRLIAWINDCERKTANTAFTEGSERQVAYAVEAKLSAYEKAGPEDEETENDLAAAALFTESNLPEGTTSRLAKALRAAWARIRALEARE